MPCQPGWSITLSSRSIRKKERHGAPPKVTQIKTRSLAARTTCCRDIYIDNLLFLANDTAQIEADRRILLENAIAANVILNPVPPPAEDLEYWNLQINLNKKTITLKDSFLAKLKSEVQRLDASMQVRDFFRLLGHLNYASQILELHLSHYYRALGALRRLSLQFNEHIVDFESPAQLRQQELKSLRQWADDVAAHPTITLGYPPHDTATGGDLSQQRMENL